MIKKLGMACLLLAFVCGCMDAKSVLDVKKDGSGTYTETVIVSKQTETMMAQMPGPGGPGGAKANPFANKEKAKKKATEMGCTFVGLKESKTAQGESCYTTTYSFTDINKVKVNFSNSGPQGPGGPGGPGAQPSAEEKAKEMTTFTFTKGSPAKLVIHGPKDEEDKKDKSASAGPADKSDSQFGAIAELEQQMAQMPPPPSRRSSRPCRWRPRSRSKARSARPTHPTRPRTRTASF